MLSTKQRAVLSFDPDMSNEEIAEALGMPLGSTKRLITQTIEEMGTQSRAGATFQAMRDGLLSIDDIVVGKGNQSPTP